MLDALFITVLTNKQWQEAANACLVWYSYNVHAP